MSLRERITRLAPMVQRGPRERRAHLTMVPFDPFPLPDDERERERGEHPPPSKEGAPVHPKSDTREAR